jgi:hypothetical protein
MLNSRIHGGHHGRSYCFHTESTMGKTSCTSFDMDRYREYRDLVERLDRIVLQEQ